jgi:hypothetical protein
MYTLTCKITFADGALIEARVSVDSPLSRGHVEWIGAVDRVVIDEIDRVAQESRLRSFCKTLARRLGAQYSETSTGEFNRWER